MGRRVLLKAQDSWGPTFWAGLTQGMEQMGSKWGVPLSEEAHLLQKALLYSPSGLLCHCSPQILESKV